MKIHISAGEKRETYKMKREHVSEIFGLAKQYQEEDGIAASEKNPESEDFSSYTGFMFIECEACKTVKAFCARVPIIEYRCKECGHSTPLKDLKLMHMRCRCGKDWTYRTNLSVPEYKASCLECGQEVSLRLNKRGSTYVTTGDE